MMALAFVLAPVVAGGLVGYSIRTDTAWYDALKQPSWSPPKQVFGPVWTLLYAAMGYAAYLAWRAGAPRHVLGLFALQFVLNLAWSPIFFTMRNPALALVDIIALCGVLGITTVAFWKVDPRAGALLVPYLAWVAYATALNAAIVRSN